MCKKYSYIYFRCQLFIRKQEPPCGNRHRRLTVSGRPPPLCQRAAARGRDRGASAGHRQAAGFWAQMQARHWAWLYNQQGQPLAPAQLPTTLSALPDYPYRSLAGWLQDDGYFSKKDDVYFVEFAWASWLGNKMG
ncbi:ParB/Srx family N-terminal domain-containing protein [Vogesella sp. DC21W]|uniref:ParB/Srx family N-terminal domain-containing protein n=2 Tax=Vogesella aquatica TaxID=2984206 RepID=A0ABT5J1F4_9NEIS|nr:ParB/Srx family N-terminal domain-containing protein [Vogesella aquatica]